MKLIIDIPEENYKLICSDGRPFLPSYKWIKNGTPLDKIKTRIEREADYYDAEVNADIAEGLYMALELIDKTKGE